RSKRIEKLVHDRGEHQGQDAPLSLDAVVESLAVQVLHDDVAIAVGGRTEVQDFEDVVVADLAGGLRLALESLDGLRVRSRARVKDLDRDPAADPHVLAFVDGAHAARADEADDAILPIQELADRDRHPALFSRYHRVAPKELGARGPRAPTSAALSSRV